MIDLQYRQLNSVIFLYALFLTVASLYFEFVQGLIPCPLCVMQRASVLVLVLFSFSAIWIKKTIGRWIISFCQLLTTMTGSGFALRQVYLQSLPPEHLPSCGPGLNVLIQYFPLKDVIHALFYGTGECGEVTWTFLSQSMAFWSMLSFLFLFVMIVWSIIKIKE